MKLNRHSGFEFVFGLIFVEAIELAWKFPPIARIIMRVRDVIFPAAVSTEHLSINSESNFSIHNSYSSTTLQVTSEVVARPKG